MCAAAVKRPVERAGRAEALHFAVEQALKAVLGQYAVAAVDRELARAQQKGAVEVVLKPVSERVARGVDEFY